MAAFCHRRIAPTAEVLDSDSKNEPALLINCLFFLLLRSRIVMHRLLATYISKKGLGICQSKT